MLILTRMEGETIIIGDDVVVTVVSVRQNKVRLGIDAPKGIEVDRSEVRTLKRRLRRKAAESADEEAT